MKRKTELTIERANNLLAELDETLAKNEWARRTGAAIAKGFDDRFHIVFAVTKEIFEDLKEHGYEAEKQVIGESIDINRHLEVSCIDSRMDFLLEDVFKFDEEEADER